MDNERREKPPQHRHRSKGQADLHHAAYAAHIAAATAWSGEGFCSRVAQLPISTRNEELVEPGSPTAYGD